MKIRNGDPVQLRGRALDDVVAAAGLDQTIDTVGIG